MTDYKGSCGCMFAEKDISTDAFRQNYAICSKHDKIVICQPQGKGKVKLCSGFPHEKEAEP